MNSLEYLCAGFCEIAQIAAPQLQTQDEDGMVAFNVHWRNVTVDVIVRPSVCTDQAFILFELGSPQEGNPDPVQMLLALAHANFMLLRPNQPVFSCHPETNEAILQWSMSLQDSTPARLYEVIEEGVNLAHQWRQTQFPEQTGEHHVAPAGAADQYA